MHSDKTHAFVTAPLMTVIAIATIYELELFMNFVLISTNASPTLHAKPNATIILKNCS